MKKKKGYFRLEGARFKETTMREKDLESDPAA